MSGMWSVMYWLFVTPFYWITGVWYRRMRHLTLGDWFAERYESKALGAAYCVFGMLVLHVFYGIDVLLGDRQGRRPPARSSNRFVWCCSYGVRIRPSPGHRRRGRAHLWQSSEGCEAAYFTDLIQGICIIVLSDHTNPRTIKSAGGQSSATRATMTTCWTGFTYMHQQAVAPDTLRHDLGSSFRQ